MSEYQYFEFRAVDTPLKRDQMAELRKYSTRANITPLSFVNEYHWGSFKGDERRWMEQYFDAFLHLTNWGTRWLMFRLPADLEPRIEAFEAGDGVSCRVKGGHAVVSFLMHDESGDWFEEDCGDSLSELIQLRAELLAGDFRCLYLGWLAALQARDVSEEEEEPPVPAGLAELSEAQEAFCQFFHLSGDLVDAAAERSMAIPDRHLATEQIARWAAALDAGEKDAILTALIEGNDPQLGIRLRARAHRDIRGDSETDSRPLTRRTAGELLTRAEVLGGQRRKREAEEKARREEARAREEALRREKHLQRLAGQEVQLWTRVGALVKTNQPGRYDEAVTLLADLRDLARHSGQEDAFAGRLAEFHDQFKRKPTFVDRLRKSGLWE